MAKGLTDTDIDEMIIEELETSVENLTEPEDAEFVKTLSSAIGKMQHGGEYTKEELKALDSEMENFSTFDMWYREGKLKKRLEEVRAKFGFLEEYDEKTYYMKKPKTRIINGKRYIVG